MNGSKSDSLTGCAGVAGALTKSCVLDIDFHDGSIALARKVRPANNSRAEDLPNAGFAQKADGAAIVEKPLAVTCFATALAPWGACVFRIQVLTNTGLMSFLNPSSGWGQCGSQCCRT